MLKIKVKRRSDQRAVSQDTRHAFSYLPVLIPWGVLDAAGISDATKRRAKYKAGVVSSKKAPWYWWLPGVEHEPEDAPKNGESEAL